MPDPSPIEWFMAEVRVADWRASARWYVEVLRLRPVLEDEAGRFLLMEAGASRLAIKQGPPDEGRGSVRLVFRVEDVEAERARLIGLGVVVSEPTSSSEGYREVRLTDPDGTPIRLFSWADQSSSLTEAR